MPDINTYSVVFDANGGSGAPTTEHRAKGEPFIFTTDHFPPDKGTSVINWNDHIFKGWGLTRNTVRYTNPGDVYEKSLDVTLYAIWAWEEPIKVDFVHASKEGHDVVLKFGYDTAHAPYADRVDHFRIQKKVSNYAWEDLVYSIPVSFQDTYTQTYYDYNVQENGYYQYRVIAVNETGYAISDISNIVYTEPGKIDDIFVRTTRDLSETAPKHEITFNSESYSLEGNPPSPNVEYKIVYTYTTDSYKKPEACEPKVEINAVQTILLPINLSSAKFYAAKAVVESEDFRLESEWSNWSNECFGATIPFAPSISTPIGGPSLDRTNKTVRIEWQHSSQDNSLQTGYSIQKDGSSEPEPVQNPTENYHILDISGFEVNEPCIYRLSTSGASVENSTYEYGASSSIIFNIVEKPTLHTIEFSNNLPFTLGLVYADISGSFLNLTVSVYKYSDNNELEMIFNNAINPTVEGTSDPTVKHLNYVFAPNEIALLNGAKYNVVVTATSTTGLYGSFSGDVEMNYEEPCKPLLDFYFNDEVVEWLINGGDRTAYSYGSMDISIGYDASHPTAQLHSVNPKDSSKPGSESNYINELTIRSYTGLPPKKIELYRQNPLNEIHGANDSVIRYGNPILLSDSLQLGSIYNDLYCPLNTPIKYVCKAYHDNGEVSVTEETKIRDATASFFLFGDNDGFENIAYLVFNTKESINVSNPQSTEVYYADREWPVAYSMPQLGMTVNASGYIYNKSDEAVWMKLWEEYGGICYYKSHFGLCFPAKVVPQFEHQDEESPFRASISLSITRIDGDIR